MTFEMIKKLALTAVVVVAGASSAFAETVPVANQQLAMLPAPAAAQPVRHLVQKTPLAWPKNTAQNVDAQVVVHYTINPDGTVDNVVAQGPNAAFTNAAKDAVSHFVYTPADTATPGVEAVALFHAAK